MSGGCQAPVQCVHADKPTSAASAAELEMPPAPQRRFVRKPYCLFDVEREIRALL